MSLSCRHSSKHLRHWTHHNRNQIWVAFHLSLFNCCFVAQKRGIGHNMTANWPMPISLHVTVMPAFFWTFLALNIPQLQTDAHFITHCCHADILPNTLGTDTYTTTANRCLFHNALVLCQLSSKQMPISQHVAVMPTFFQTPQELNMPQLQTDRRLFHFMSLSCQHSSKHLRHSTYHNCNQISSFSSITV